MCLGEIGEPVRYSEVAPPSTVGETVVALAIFCRIEYGVL